MKFIDQLSLEDLWVRALQEIDFLHDIPGPPMATNW